MQDDGSGIDLEKIRAKTVRLNMLSTAEAANLSEEQLFEYIFKPGFSTTDKANELSGRGMGLDAVLLQIAALKGSLTLTSQLGVGTTFTLRLPFTLTVTQLLVFSINGTLLSVPVDSLAGTISVSADKIEKQDSQEFYRWQNKLVPLIPTLKLPSYDSPQRSIFDRFETCKLRQPSNEIMLLIVSSKTKAMAIEVDQILMQEELVIKSFTSAIAAPSYLLGCTVLGDGRIVPVLDGLALLTWQEKQKEKPITDIKTDNKIVEANNTRLTQTAPTILLVDDSLTIRRNLSVFLRKQGYQIVEAGNGLEGLEQLKQKPEIRAVISDLDMPKMNGLEFLSRFSEEFSKSSLPIVMLTTRNTEQYRQLAKRLGASAYLTKPYLELELLNTLQTLIN